MITGVDPATGNNIKENNRTHNTGIKIEYAILFKFKSLSIALILRGYV
jgi:hypothetical protein